jgi:hypothetical protein
MPAMPTGTIEFPELPNGTLVPAQQQANMSHPLYTLTQSLAETLMELGSLVVPHTFLDYGLAQALPGAFILTNAVSKRITWRGVGLGFPTVSYPA